MHVLVRYPATLGAGHQRHQIFRTLTYAHAVRRGETKFCVVIKLDKKIVFTGSTTFQAIWPIFCETNADVRCVCATIIKTLQFPVFINVKQLQFK